MYLIGGWTGEKYATAILRFSLPDAAAVVARLPEALRDPAVALHAGKLYVAGGRTAAGPTKAVYVVRLAAGTVSVLGQLPRAVAGGTLVVADGTLFLLGGKGESGPVASVTRIDPATGRIEAAGKMPRPLAGAAAVRAGGSTLVLGGSRPTSILRLRSG
jgi:N-acetylneuraminic acid mutarotase